MSWLSTSTEILHAQWLKEDKDHSISMIFLHGLLGNGRNLRTLAQTVIARSTAKANALLVDLPGHGQSRHIPCTSLHQAAQAVAACRYPPTGIRSSGPIRAMHYAGGDYFGNANDEIVLMAMIETKQGLENLDAICATPGLDAVYIGPADLSFALGLPPRGDNPDPLHLETCDKIKDCAHRHGIKAVMHCASADFAAGAIKRGFDMVMLTSDLACMIAGARAQLDELKAKTG